MILNERHAWHTLDVESVINKLKTDPIQGLSGEEYLERVKQFGRNELTSVAQQSLLVKFLLQFHQPLVYILITAALVTWFLDEWIDSLVILGVVLVNAIVGFLQEYRAQQAIDALARSLSILALVSRSGHRSRIPAAELVPGDVVHLQSGDQVPADLRLIQVRDLRVAEAALTGESLPVEKATGSLPPETVLGDRKNMAFATALVTYGQATGIVVETGDRTAVGAIQGLINNADQLSTPLTKQIARFSHWLMYIILGLAVFTFTVGLIQGQSAKDLFHATVALCVAAIPEGLPAAVTVVLAIGVWRMARRNAIIRKLPAVEALGSTSIICSDKTGTLTQNEMTVQRLIAGSARYTVHGTGYAPEGSISPDSHNETDPQALEELLRCGLLCNDSQLVQEGTTWKVQGDPTEAALIVSAIKGQLDPETLARDYPRVDTVPFESEYQYMATLHDPGPGKPRIIYLKGSVERVTDRCTGLDVQGILARASEMGQQGLRVLAFARKEVPAEKSSLTHEDLHSGLQFLGLQGMMDPPRPEAIRSVTACHQAGVRVKMITGDHASTAAAVACQLGLTREQARVLTGADLANMNDADLLVAAETTDVFARVSPEQKLRLVKALQARGRVVAMTGDGVNDAPALKQADIGVAMGITGTDVAKDASDMILTDDNFASIQAAVEEGRGVFDNLTKFLVWTLPTNLGEGLVILLCIVLALPLPILPVQILWINMTTAVLLGMMLTFEPKEDDLMQRPPRSPKQSFIDAEMLRRMILVGVAMLLGAFGLFRWELMEGSSEDAARTTAVSVFIIVEAFYLFNCRHLRKTIWQSHFWTNPWAFAGFFTMIALQLLFVYSPVMNRLFHTAPMSFIAWMKVLGIAMIVFILVELETWWMSRKDRPVQALSH
jgi:Ca2+-transporting ATPase